MKFSNWGLPEDEYGPLEGCEIVFENGTRLRVVGSPGGMTYPKEPIEESEESIEESEEPSQAAEPDPPADPAVQACRLMLLKDLLSQQQLLNQRISDLIQQITRR